MKKKQTIKLTLSVFLMTFVLVASVFTVQTYASTKTITLWDNYNAKNDRAAMRKIIEMFEEEYPDIEVEERVMPNLESDSIIRTSFTGGNPPDIHINEEPYSAKELLRKGKVMDLTDWFDKYGDRFSDAGLSSARTEDGRYYSVPFVVDSVVHVFYNKEIAEELNISEPKNYTEFLEACEKAKNAGYTPIALGTKAGYPALHWFNNFVGEFAGADAMKKIISRKSPDDGPKWTDPGFVKAAEKVYELAQKNYFPDGAAMMSYDTGNKMLFLSGDALFNFTGSWYTSWDISPEFDWGHFLFPEIEGVGKPGFTDGQMHYLMKFVAAKDTEHPEAVKKFLEFATRPDVFYKTFFKMGNRIGATKGSYRKEELTDFQEEVVWAIENINVVEPPEVHMPSEVGYGTMYEKMTDMVAGLITPEEFAELVEKAHQEALKKR